MALGAVPQSYDCHRMPGWDRGAVGYHIDDGKIFETGCREEGREVEGMGYCDDIGVRYLPQGSLGARERGQCLAVLLRATLRQ